MAWYQLNDQPAFQAQLDRLMKAEGGMRAFEAASLDGLSGADLIIAWREGFEETANAFSIVNPKVRLKWAGPDMSARSSITARQMETWAHGQEVYDHLGVVRENTDRIRNIAILGVNTYKWTYVTRGETPPGPMPFLELTAPSGARWTFGEPNTKECIAGPAEDFCQVVTQVRNIADTRLEVTGHTAADWMSKAQCFAGPPATPPPPGTRHTVTA